jgi:hypothetical protein
MKASSRFLKGLLLAVLPCFVYGQSTNDTIFLANSVKAAKAVYEKQTAGEGPLFNGVQYKEWAQHNSDDGQPYYLSDDWIDGSIYYDGAQFENVPMMYDLVRDQMIIDQPLSHFKMQLIKGKVMSFTLNDHQFVHLFTDSTVTLIKPGFYELLYNGKVKVYAKYKKRWSERFESNIVRQVYDEKIEYFIFKDNAYYSVKGKHSVLKVFSNKKVMLRKYLNKNKVNFTREPALAIAQAAKFYEESDQQP